MVPNMCVLYKYLENYQINETTILGVFCMVKWVFFICASMLHVTTINIMIKHWIPFLVLCPATFTIIELSIATLILKTKSQLQFSIHFSTCLTRMGLRDLRS